MKIGGKEYSYEVVQSVDGFGSPFKGENGQNEYILRDVNTHLNMAYGTKKECTAVAKFLTLHGTTWLAMAIHNYKGQ